MSMMTVAQNSYTGFFNPSWSLRDAVEVLKVKLLRLRLPPGRVVICCISFFLQATRLFSKHKRYFKGRKSRMILSTRTNVANRGSLLDKQDPVFKRTFSDACGSDSAFFCESIQTLVLY